jgi:rhodanese-related sulfurtransferase
MWIIKSAIGRLILTVALTFIIVPLVIKSSLDKKHKGKETQTSTTSAGEGTTATYQVQESAPVEGIEPAEAHAKQESGEAVLLDVRGSGQAARSMLRGAANIPLAELHRRKDELPQDKLIIVYAYTTIPAEIEAAKVAASLLSQNGERRAIVLKGSSAEWLAAGLPLETNESKKAAQE